MGTIEASVDKAVSTLEDQLKLWHAKLNDLVARVEIAGRDTKVEARKHLEDMKSKLEVVQARLDDARSASAGHWDRLTAGVESSWRDLEAEFHDLVHKPRKETPPC